MLASVADRDDGTPRRVLVTVKIETNGARCGMRCPWRGPPMMHDQRGCLLFDGDVSGARGGARLPACLALDEPDRTAAEAQAHGLGSQP